VWNCPAVIVISPLSRRPRNWNSVWKRPGDDAQLRMSASVAAWRVLEEPPLWTATAKGLLGLIGLLVADDWGAAAAGLARRYSVPVMELRKEAIWSPSLVPTNEKERAFVAIPAVRTESSPWPSAWLADKSRQTAIPIFSFCRWMP